MWPTLFPMQNSEGSGLKIKAQQTAGRGYCNSAETLSRSSGWLPP